MEKEENKKTKKEVTQKKEQKGVKKFKKGVKVILIVLACLVGMLLVYEVGIYSDGDLDTSNPMTRQKVIALLEKGKEYPNYYYSPVDEILGERENNKTEIYIKDNIEKTVYNGRVIEWKNYNTNEDIHILGEHEGKKYAAISKISDSSIENEYNQSGFDYSLIADEEHFDYDFKYLGRKEIEGRSYVLVKVWNKKSNELFATKFLIDEETGLITKRTDYVQLGIMIGRMVTNRNVKIDVVTDEDVARPDLTGYEILK